MTKNYDTEDAEKVAKIKNWIGRESLHFIETLTIEEEEICKSSVVLFKTAKKFKPQHNETIPSLQNC